MPDINETMDQLGSAFEEFKSKHVARVDALAVRQDEVEKKLNRPGFGSGGSAEQSGDPAEMKAFTTFLRHGRAALDGVEQKYLTVGDDTGGGFLAPGDFQNEILKNIVQISPVRQAARVGLTGSGEVMLPVRTGTPTGGWVGEIETRSSTQSAYGMRTIPVHEMACYVDVSSKLLDDASFDVGAEIASDLAEEFARLEGLAFVSGDGVKKPLGFMSSTELSYSPSGSASVIADADGTADGLISLMYAIKPQYRARGTWMANGTTIAALRKLKEATTNAYIWQPGLQAGQPDTLLSRPIVEAVDMPDIAGNAYPLVFGDFSKAFRIYDKAGGFSILRDSYTQAAGGIVRFHARMRVGGAVVLPEAIRKLKIATS